MLFRWGDRRGHQAYPKSGLEGSETSAVLWARNHPSSTQWPFCYAGRKDGDEAGATIRQWWISGWRGQHRSPSSAVLRDWQPTVLFWAGLNRWWPCWSRKFGPTNDFEPKSCGAESCFCYLLPPASPPLSLFHVCVCVGGGGVRWLRDLHPAHCLWEVRWRVL
jgi:hypothetical protein